MQKLRYHQNPSMWEGEPATGIASLGVVTAIDGEIFIDETPLLAYLKDGFLGRKGMFEFVFPDEPEYEIDPKILPLVQVLQKKGYHTMGSCEGHFPAEKNFDRAYVAFYAVNNTLSLPVALPEGWTWERSEFHQKIYKMVTKRAHSAEKLVEVHTLIDKAIEFFSV